MLSIPISFGSHAAYSVPSLSLTGAGHQLQIDFEDGEHVFTSPDFALGTIHAMQNAPLMGRLIFRYTLGTEDGVGSITVCDADYESADGMTLMTFPAGREELSCFEHASAAGFAADEIHRNGRWNTRSPLVPGASRILKDIARDAARAVIAALETQEVFLNVRSMFPEALPLDAHHQMCLVFRDGEFLCTYDELDQHGGSDRSKGAIEVWDIFSQYDGTVQFPTTSTFRFANVIGSTNDPKPDKFTSWLALWNAKLGRSVSQCSSLNFPTTITCSTNFVGGHVITGIVGMKADSPPVGSDVVRIIPICKVHNAASFKDAMMPIKERWAVKLKKYMQK